MCCAEANLYDLGQHQKRREVMNNISKLILTLATSFLLSGMASTAVSQEVDLQTLCGRFPLNSRCQNRDSPETKSNKTQLKTRQLDRELFCEQFSLNSKCQDKPLEVIKLNLNRSGEDNEWIRIERKGNILKLLHTTEVKDELVSGILNGAISFIPSPILPDVNKYNWENHRVIGVSFKSDHCKTDNCMLTGKNTLKISEKINIHQGTFTIQYQEEDLIRAITFKIPPDVEVEIANTVTVSTPVKESE
ncbi:MAG: hypothetical protein HC930_14855 [Hydrococcus sp. SU_1_0]|nr:hypothetical protein [Hydrococcus sp. SU_1_0]